MQQKGFNPVTTMLLLLGFPAILYFAINYFIINKYFPEYSSTDIAALINSYFTSQPNRNKTTMQSPVQPVTAKDLNGKWNARVGESPAIIYLNNHGNTIYGTIYYKGVKENLQGEIQGSNLVILRGTSYKRLKGRGLFNLDKFEGNITPDSKSMRGNYTDAIGHGGYWFAARDSTYSAKGADNHLEFLTITIQSSPPGALVKIDRETKGTTPVTVTLKSGSHGITIEKQGYKTIWDILDVKKDKKRVFDYTLSSE